LPWPYDLEVPGHLRALALRCTIPALIPGHGVYLWVDADAWVQDWTAVDLYRRTAESRQFCITSEVDRSFDLAWMSDWSISVCQNLYGARLAQRLRGRPLLNAGVFAGHRDAPHWAAWKKRVEQALVSSAADFNLDQTALNILAFVDGFDVAILPPQCNWICHRALPRTSMDGTVLLDPQPPHQPLGIIHMTSVTKTFPSLVLRTIDDRLVARSLRYAATPSDAIDPDNPVTAELALARADCVTGHYYEAIWRLQRLVAADPNRPRAWAQLGVTASQVRDLAEAARALRRAVLLKPDNASWQLDLGTTYLRQGRAEEAEAAFRRALQLSPDDRSAQVRLDTAVADQTMPAGDYVSPGLLRVKVDKHFPNVGWSGCDDGGLRQPDFRSGQNRYADKRVPHLCLVTRDEAHILFNTALGLDGLPALDIGSSMGFSTCHLALGGVRLDVVDPALRDPGVLQSVMDSLTSAGVIDACRLLAASVPGAVEQLGRRDGMRWSLGFIDEKDDGDAARQAAEACEPFLQPDAVVLLGSLLSPAAAAGLHVFRERGWNTGIYRTARIMGVAWRGQSKPIRHSPDPSLSPELPPHLTTWTVVGGDTAN